MSPGEAQAIVSLLTVEQCMEVVSVHGKQATSKSKGHFLHVFCCAESG